MAAVLSFLPSRAIAHVTQVVVTRVESPTLGGVAFGTVGQYEKVVGRVSGEVQPTDALNAVIADITLAPRNARGLVEYSMDFYVLRPVDASRGNHRVLYEINNRGGAFALGQFNNAVTGGNDPSTAADAGNGFLMRQGYTLVWSGWDPTAPAGFGITVPIAANPDGSAIVGPSLEEFVVDTSTMLTGPLTYPAATLDKGQATLSVRVKYDDPATLVPAASWEFVNAQTIRLLPAGTAFQRGTLYELVYPATKPLVAGLGFAATRDFASFLRGANSLVSSTRYIYSYCFSQPCRMMHDFLWLGFNEDENGQRVFDAMLSWVGGASGIFLNYRFAQPGRTHRQHIGRWYPEYRFPFTNQTLVDSVTGQSDGRFTRCTRTQTCPKLFEINSENEYWSKAGSILHTDFTGHDLPDVPDVRSYFMASLPHSAGVGPTGPGICQQNRNPLVANPVLRALLVDLDQWVTSGTAPPPSRLPRRDDGTLVEPGRNMFPSLPGVTYNARLHTGDLFDFGRYADLGILTVLPPALLGTPYPVFVPVTDADGNDVAGIRLPEVAVPLATYTGWGLRAYPSGANEGCDAAGQQINFSATQTDRVLNGDPRLSIQERYATHDVYAGLVAVAALRLEGQRFLLPEDAQAYIAAALNSSVGR